MESRRGGHRHDHTTTIDKCKSNIGHTQYVVARSVSSPLVAGKKKKEFWQSVTDFWRHFFNCTGCMHFILYSALITVT